MAYSATSKDLMGALISKLYHIITGDDPEIKYPNSKYISWIMPGIPFAPEDFNFCVKGLAGSTAEEMTQLAFQGFLISKLFDFIPDPSGLVMDHKMQQTIFATTQDTISSVYRDVLQFSKVVNKPITEEQQKIIDEKLEFIRSKNGVYKEYLKVYMDEATALAKARTEAQGATGADPASKEKVAYWINMGAILKQKVNDAERALRSEGYRDQLASTQAYIAQITENSMVLYKDRLENNFKPVSTPNVGAVEDFYLTTLVPGNFANSPGWTEFTFGEQDFHQYLNKTTTKGSLGGGVKYLGLFKVGGGSASTSTEETDETKTASNFTCTFEFAQIPILRPWFEPGFFSMRGWDLSEIWDLNWDKKVSNGEDPPVGRLVAYPTTALFVRNVSLSFDESSDYSHYFNSVSGGSGSAGWGIFRAKGSFSSTHEQKKVDHTFENGKLNIHGMQLIGFINNLIPKSPNLHPNIKPQDLVGGTPSHDDPLPVL